MNEKSSIRSDDVLRQKIIILSIYCLFTCVIIALLGDSGIPLVSQLVLQLGSIIDGSPLQVKP